MISSFNVLIGLQLCFPETPKGKEGEFERSEHVFREAVNDLKALQFTIRVKWFFNKFRIIELLSNLVKLIRYL